MSVCQNADEVIIKVSQVVSIHSVQAGSCYFKNGVRHIVLPRTAGDVLTEMFFADVGRARARPASLLKEKREVHSQWTHNQHEVRSHPFR